MTLQVTCWSWENGEKNHRNVLTQEFADDESSCSSLARVRDIAKAIVLSDLQNIRRAGLRALNLNEATTHWLTFV